MTFRQRIILDRVLAVPLCVVCDVLARLVGRILRRDHSVGPQTTRQIVVSKLVGMGSILQATPLLRALKSTYPQSHITFVTLEANRCLVERLEGVDEIQCLNDSGLISMSWSTMRVIVALIRKRIDHYLDLELYSGFACLLSVFSLARNRFGFYRHSTRFKKGIYTHLIYFNTRMPVRRLYLQLGRIAGVPAGSKDQLGPIRIESSERLAVRAKLAAWGPGSDQGYILINPNASDLLIERRWPESYVIEILTRLAQLGHTIALLGSKSEEVFTQSLLDRVPASLRGKVLNTAGKLSLGEALALIEGAACVLTNDTGPMHMAFALSRPTVCLFGPADPVHYCVDSPNVLVLYAPVPCSPCIYEVDEPPCRGNNVCMQRMSPEFVLSQMRALIEKTGSAPSKEQTGSGTVRLPLVWDNDEGRPLGMVIRPRAIYE